MACTVKRSLQAVFSGLPRMNQWIHKNGPGQPKGRELKKSISSLDGVRAIACLTVIAYHISLITRDTGIWNPWNEQYPLLASVLFSGWSGVTLFFVLSGFLLFLPYARALLFAEEWPSIRQFYLRRALRIIPAYYITLLLLLLFPVLQPQPLLNASMWNIGLFLIFLMDSTKATFQLINGPFWTLAVEWQFYMLLPFLALGMRLITYHLAPQKRCWAVIGCLMLIIAWGVSWSAWGIWVLNLHSNSDHVGLPLIQSLFLFLFYGRNGKFLEDFAVGMLVCLIYVSAERARREQFANWLERKCFWLWGSGILLLFYGATSELWPIFHFFSILVQNSMIQLLFSCGYGLCILAILFNTTTLQRSFSWQPLCSLGKISYSLYMWHLPLLILLMNNIEQRFHGGNRMAIYALYWVYVGLVIVPFCANFYRLFEKPGITLATRIKKNDLSPVLVSVPPLPHEKNVEAGRKLV